MTWYIALDRKAHEAVTSGLDREEYEAVAVWLDRERAVTRRTEMAIRNEQSEAGANTATKSDRITEVVTELADRESAYEFFRSRKIEKVRNVFKYHPPSGSKRIQHQTIDTACIHFAEVLIRALPVCEDTDRAIEAIRKVRFYANSAIALDGNNLTAI